MNSASPLKPNALIGPYRIIREIAAGGMAMVYLAYQPSLDRQVAIKVISPALVQESTFIERLRLEARAIARLSHPNIVTIHDYGEHEGLFYIVMEYVPGGTLRARMRNPLTPEYASFVLDQISSALDYAHDQGIVHRDIKPGNVLLKTERWLVLSDFGVAKVLGSQTKSMTGTGGGIGTPDYIAPEQIEGGTVDRRADIYALGAVLFEMLTGRPPFVSTTPAHLYVQHLLVPPPSLQALDNRLSPALDAVIQRALQKRPDDRYQRAGELAEAFRRAVYQGRAAPISHPSAPGGLLLVEPRSEPGQASSTPGAPAQAASYPSGVPVAPVSHAPQTSVPVASPARRRPLAWLLGGASGLVALVLLVIAALVWLRPGAAVQGASPVSGGSQRVSVPASEFIMGDETVADTRPRQTVRTEAFQIDRLEVTRDQFRRFVEATGYKASPASLRFNPSEGNLPVNWVSWLDATAYCRWAGGRLPTEAEWEKAARGTDGRAYPWGNELDLSRLNSAESKTGQPKPVGSYPLGASPYGALDMAGNVLEWTQSQLRPYPYVATDGRNDPEGGGQRVVRGGSWENTAETARTFMRAAFPNDFVHPTVGFRCAY